MTGRECLLSLGIILLASVLLLVSCRDEEKGEAIHSGFFSSGFEVSSFTPCGSGEKWWVGGTDIETRYRSLGVEPYEEVFARLKGELSEEGRYGHLGAYSRQFVVTEVVEMRRKEAGDCGTP